MESKRKPTYQEITLIELLIKKASITVSDHWKERILVCPMDDGGMGSLYLSSKEETDEGRMMGKQVSEFQFVDKDGVDVLASLNVDTLGNLYELEIWKTDFSKLIQLPEFRV